MASNEQDINREIRVAAQKLAGTYNKDLLHLSECIVTEVDFDNRTCTCSAINDTSTTSIELVRFQSVVDDGVILVPKVGSNVTVLMSIRIQPLIVLYSELDNVFIVSPKVQFNKGQLGGMVKVIDLVTKLNNIEKAFNDFVTNYNVHTHTNSGGTTTPPLPLETKVLVPTQRNDIENKAITQ